MMRSAPLYCRQPMRDYEHRAPGRDAPHIFLDDPLAFVIEGARGFVENEDARVADQRAGDGDALTLTARQRCAALADNSVVTVRQFEDELMSAGERRHADHPFQRHARIGERDVLAHRAVEEHILLQDQADLTPQPGSVNHCEIDPVHQHAAALGRIEPLHQLGQCRLPGS
jgi:hypothetical protein